MRIIKDILRLKFDSNLSQRQIARSLNIGLGTVSLHLKRAHQARLTWPLPEGMSDTELERLLFPGQLAATRGSYVEPDYAAMHEELKRKGGD